MCSALFRTVPHQSKPRALPVVYTFSVQCVSPYIIIIIINYITVHNVSPYSLSHPPHTLFHLPPRSVSLRPCLSPFSLPPPRFFCLPHPLSLPLLTLSVSFPPTSLGLLYVYPITTASSLSSFLSHIFQPHILSNVTVLKNGGSRLHSI